MCCATANGIQEDHIGGINRDTKQEQAGKLKIHFVMTICNTVPTYLDILQTALQFTLVLEAIS